MRGGSVTVKHRTQTGTDAHNNPVYTYTDEVVDNVLYRPQSNDDANDGADAVEGVEQVVSVTFPKSYQVETLRGADIVIPAYGSEPFHVIGDPMRDVLNCPTRWNYNVKAVRRRGF